MKGIIGKFNLDNWWNNELTAEERKIIDTVYAPMASNGTLTGMLTSGNVDMFDNGTAFMANLLSWFHKPEYYQIINKIVKQADLMANNEKNAIEKHFYYLSKIKAFYPCREQFPEALDLAIKACEEQIKNSKEAITAFKKEGGLPEHTGFKQLCIIRDKQGNYLEVIRLAEQAKNEGWPGDWEKRIEKANKKIGK